MEKEEERMNKYLGGRSFGDLPIHLKVGLVVYSVGFVGGLIVLFYAVYSWFTRFF